MKYSIWILFTVCSVVISSHAQANPDPIIGKWMSLDKNLMVEVYKQRNEYKARVIWFDASDDITVSMSERRDKKNPDKTLRNQKILGMEVLHGLVYNAKEKEWQDGRIYDSSSGKDWSAKAWITKEGCLKVRGFWHFEFLGQNIYFKKI